MVESYKTKTPRVSVVVTNYNYGRFLRSAIDSALSQTYANCEVIVVDDGSTDDSRAVIEEYGDRIKAICKENGGQGSAINAGFAASGGEWIIFLDADDRLSSHAVETVVHAADEDVSLIRYAFEIVDADGNPSGQLIGDRGARLPDPTFGPFGVDSPGGAKAFRRSKLEKAMPLPEEEWRMGADAYLAVLCSSLGTVLSIDEPLGQYRIHGSNHVAEASLGLNEIRRGISGDLGLYAKLRTLTSGLPNAPERWLSRYPQHWMNRITSIRESPSDHPWNDSIIALVASAVAATWRQPFWNVRRKLVYTFYVLACALSPRITRRRLLKVTGGNRSGLVRLLLGH